MPPSIPPYDKHGTGTGPKAVWLTSAKNRFFQLGKNAPQWHCVSHKLCTVGVNPENLYHMTLGTTEELEKTLCTIYANHGVFILQARCRDEDGTFYLDCSKPGRKGPRAEVVLCANAVGGAGAVVEEAEGLVGQGEAGGREEWEVVGGEGIVGKEDGVEEDDWVKV